MGAAGYEKFNPILHVKDWKVPMLVVHSQLDYRIPVEQGIAAFTALQRKGIESKYLYFPDENHWVLKPQNSLLWHDTVNAWLKAHIGSDACFRGSGFQPRRAPRHHRSRL